MAYSDIALPGKKKNPDGTNADGTTDQNAAQPSAAFQAGQATRNAVTGGVGALGDAMSALGRTVTAPARAVSSPVIGAASDFASGLIPPGTSLPSLSMPAAAATPAPAQAPRSAPTIARPNFSDTTAGATTTPQSALSQSGRPLGIGQMVDGVATFSDGGGIPDPRAPRTMTDAQLGIGQQNVGGISAPAAVPSIATPPQQATYDPSSDIAQAGLNRQSDIASILTGDPRSVAGTAARAARIEANSYASRIGNRSNRARTIGDPNAALAPLIAGADANANAEAGGALAKAKEGSDTNRFNIGQLGELQREQLRNQTYLQVANTRGDAMRDVADTRANAPKINGPLEHAHAMIYKARLDAGDSPEDAQAAADAYRPPGSAPAQPTAPSTPKNGEVRNGYRFKGGDPADKNSWEKV